MIDRDSPNVEAAAYLAREDAYPDDPPSPDECAADTARQIPRTVAEWHVALGYRPVGTDDVPF